MTLKLTERYAAAERLLPHKWNALVVSGRVKPNWVGETDRFWYRNPTAAGTEFLLVDPATGTKTHAFDHDRLARALTNLLGGSIDPTTLPVTALELLENKIRLAAGGKIIDIASDSYSCEVLGPAPGAGEKPSPDGSRVAFVRNHNLVVCDTETGYERELTTDGIESFSYATPPDVTAYRSLTAHLKLSLPPMVVWSPDSRRLATHRIDQRNLQLMHLVQAAPPGGGRPRLTSYHYAMVGEHNLATAELFVFDVTTGDATPAKCPPFLTAYASPIRSKRLWWSRSGHAVYWLSGDRGDKTVQLRSMDARTGVVRVLVEEVSDTTVQTAPFFMNLNSRVLATGEVLWWSERSGWGHLYLYDDSGNVRQLTSGDWLVRDLVALDEVERIAVIAGAGREPNMDPYARQLYRLTIDTGDLEPLTADTLDHQAVGSPTGRYVIDVASWVDAPARSIVLDTMGKTVVKLENADPSKAVEAAYEPPERFRVKAADGVTEIYGLLYKPHDFDPNAKYPVIDDIYPGPQITAAPLRYPPSRSEMGLINAPSLAALGFAVIVVDGRGTPFRSKAFQEHSRGTREGEYLEDHIAAIRQVAADHHWLDLDRVGICGHSGGGYAAARGMLRHPEFYKVAVSISGDHDDAMYQAFWGEKYIEATDYASQANAFLAERLQGKLFLIHGEMDDNVTPHLTMRLVDALITANKDFDLLIVPNAEHSMHVHQAYLMRRVWDYLVRHLRDEEPPMYRVDDIPVDDDLIAEILGA